MAMFLYNPQSRFCSPMENILDDMMSDMTRPMRRICPYWRDLPLDKQCNIGNALGNVVNDKEKFSVEVDVSQFKPEELKVNVGDGQLVVEGHHEEKSDESGTIERHFIRKFALPEDADQETVQSHLTDKGVLSVFAKKTSLQGPQSRTIPILPAPKEKITNGDAK